MSRLLFAAVLVLPSSLTAAEYHLPGNGRWFVMQGGDTLNVNHHMRVPSQWFGVDLSKVGGPSGRELFRGTGRAKEDYFSWGEPVLAPAAGTVETVHDGEPDNELGKTDRNEPFGNFVCIRVGAKEYAFLAHFQKGSLRVKAGDKVKAGQVLGKCGNSGNTTMPHIHFHVQSDSKPFSGRGRNITFRQIDVTLAGKEFKKVNWPVIRGLFVANTKASNAP